MTNSFREQNPYESPIVAEVVKPKRKWYEANYVLLWLGIPAVAFIIFNVVMAILYSGRY